MKITTVGIDLAKNVFSLHGITQSGAVVLRKTLRREQLLQNSGLEAAVIDEAVAAIGPIAPAPEEPEGPEPE